MPVWSEIARQSDAAWAAAHPRPVTGQALIERYAEAVDAVALYRAGCGREYAANGPGARHDVWLWKVQEAQTALATLESALAAEDATTRAAAREAALAALETPNPAIHADAFTVAARRQMRDRMVASGSLMAAAE